MHGSAHGAESTQGLRIRAVTYNLRSGLQRQTHNRPVRGLEAVARVLRTLQGQAAQPEHFIAFVQEIETGAPRTGLMNQPTWLRDHLGWRTGRFFQAFDKSLVHEGRQTTWRYGNGLFAPSTLVDNSQERNPWHQQLEGKDYSRSRPNWPPWFGEPRVAGHMVSHLGHRAVQLCCTHLGVTPDQRDIQRARLAEHLVESMELDRPLIVAGDFNAGIDHRHFVEDPPSPSPCTSPQQELGEFCARTGLTDVLTQLGVPGWTYPTPRPTFALDRILVSRHFVLEGAGVYVDHAIEAASDHYAVFADLLLK